MNYQETVDWMFQQLPMYQAKGKAAYKTDLSNTILLAKHLKNPEHKFKSIHVAGTNGKGSTCHILASILQEAGYKVGLYTSPHLKDYRERIKINGKTISKQFVRGFVKKHKIFFEVNALSFFEMTVGLAFDYFAKKEVDIAIIEVGLGGRLDSTNIINPEVSVITNIGLDHTQFLGDTLPLIAAEKAGIIKKNIPIVIGETHIETTSIFNRIAKENKSEITFADKIDNVKIYETDLKGSYQKNNIKTVLVTLKKLQNKQFKISKSNITKGLLNVVKNTGLLGRWQILNEVPKIVCDTAHNKEGLSYVMKQLAFETYNNLHIVFGIVNDKDLDSILPLLPKEATYYFCKPMIERGFDAGRLQDIFRKKGFTGNAYSSVKEALNMAKNRVTNNDFIYVGGSTFVVAEII
ncbi:bifunctional folylpolyglutamate synthase/dihydrofolate synthase [Winogradskyella immobilis]|uniref:Dihydrofolate synthase/folylpolyglutamate synthase n=1 Tax=Winogradskyella immobilis TaxID=2816852 RepID=A0ABS8ENH0_9FLAO|nr:folylpolyglutamate synthase/dihydrofolate synthase family protein [Winogradskyella immobilis]MCC1484758.1 bifunctional folylpolyglutamate synthase/dihydrofolate synthase [Winogradskyella immobilis]MCG0016850.1 bifunctional folylpolyglutamate synthase/dihydrofolate synthase [Winogradskyella immobilis]